MQWNLGGQSANLLDVAAKDANIVCVQELARDSVGWDSFETEEFYWVTHRDPRQWRGVGIAISLDVFDSVLFKTATKRGIWIVARVKGLGRILLGSMHAHTGVTNTIYQTAVGEFLDSCPRKLRHLPLLWGVDANEVPSWLEDEHGHVAGTSSTNLNVLVHEALQVGLQPIAPYASQLRQPTHFPRDVSRRGRQIDMIFSRMISVTPLTVDGERRHVVGSDHGAVYVDILLKNRSRVAWGNDSKARWVCKDLPSIDLIDEGDIQQLASLCTRTRPALSYRDGEEVKVAVVNAKIAGSSAAWKRVHKLRRSAKKAWHRQRLSDILGGNWEIYRQIQVEKNRKRGWWGRLLEERSAEQLRDEIVEHLEKKMCRQDDLNWDEDLQMLIGSIAVRGDFRPFCIEDVRAELHHMKCRSAVGPDKIGVHLLRHMAYHETLGPGLLELINHIVRTHQLPPSWDKSFLALLAKVREPLGVGDLRPICISSAFHKLVSRMVCSRAMPLLRQSSKISCCGKGRQAADLIGSISRIRDTTREWKLPLLLCKLDVAGAFDRVDRRKVAELILGRLRDKDRDHELLYLLHQLRSHQLEGIAPGGQRVMLRPDVGIKQGAPESAEIFGLVVDSLLSDLVGCRQWGELGLPFPELGIDLLFFQDGIFLIDDNLSRLGKKIRDVDKCLQRAGLQLAKEKLRSFQTCTTRAVAVSVLGVIVFQLLQLVSR